MSAVTRSARYGWVMCTLAWAAGALPLHAHGGAAAGTHEALAHPGGSTLGAVASWTWDPWITGGLVLLAIIYGRGWFLLKRSGANGPGSRTWETVLFVLGWATVVAALVSPVHALGEYLFSMHMTQHELLMVIAAPMIVVARPMVPLMHGLPEPLRRFAAGLTRRGWLRSAVGLVTTPVVAWLLHATALWVWHAPRLFDAALHNDVLHAIQHASFFGSALLFYWAVLENLHARKGHGIGIVLVFATAVHTAVLGALLTFAEVVLYPTYRTSAPEVGVAALQDQQLGGLIMWVPAGVVYTVLGLILLWAWLGRDAGRGHEPIVPQEAT